MNSPNLYLFSRALAEPLNQPETAFKALCKLCDEALGARLFTITDHDPDHDQVRRLYSNMPDAYPVSGTKPANKGSRWYTHCIARQQIFVVNSYAAMLDDFPDHQLIRSLGCEAVMNIPIVVAGRVLGTLNCLDAAGTYSAAKVDAAEGLRLPGAACLLLHRSLK